MRTALPSPHRERKQAYGQAVQTLDLGHLRKKGLLSGCIYFSILPVIQLYNLFCTSEPNNCTFTVGGRV